MRVCQSNKDLDLWYDANGMQIGFDCFGFWWGLLGFGFGWLGCGVELFVLLV